MEFFELTSNCNYVFVLSYPNTALTDIITALSPGMTVWRKPYFSGVGCRVPGRPFSNMHFERHNLAQWAIFLHFYKKKKRKITA